MNETIGVKGGKNDRRRSLIITKKEKKKLEKYQKRLKEKELIQLEKKVKNIQKITFLKTLPIVTIGQIIKTLTDTEEEKRKLIIEDAIYCIEQENVFSETETKEIVAAIKNGTVLTLSEEILNKLGINLEAYNRVSEYDITDIKPETPTKDDKKEKASLSTQVYIQKVIQLKKEKERYAENQKYEQEILKNQYSKDDLLSVSDLTIEEQLDKLKNKKIVDEYEKKLKDIRSDLRNLLFECDVISDESENLYDSKDAEKLLERLNIIIKKLEELQKRMDIPNYEKYDDNYLYVLVENYIEEFKNHNFVEEIKDSNLYIMISEKLDELDKKKDNLQTKIESRKEELEIDEDKFETIKEEFLNYEKFSKQLMDFQSAQDGILKDIREKMDNAVTMQERVETQVVGMRNQTRRLLRLMATLMTLPGGRSARGLATAAAIYMNFMRNIIRPPRVEARTYQEIKVEDYSKDIEKSLEQLDDIGTLLKNTSKEIDETIKEFEKEFKEYFGVIPECKKLLEDLERVRDEIKEKEEELEKIKEEQEKNLEKNNAKVKMYTK